MTAETWNPPKTDYPDISIVLPTHNGEKYIRSSIESVLGQTYRNIELIIVLDGCTDGSEAIAREYATQDARTGILNLRHNVKLPTALNKGFQKARGRYYTWTSDDNLYLPEAMTAMIVPIEKDKADIVVAGMDIIDEKGRIIDTHKERDIKRLRLCNVCGACFLYRSAIHWTLNGYNPAVFLVEDYDFFIRAYCSGYRFATLSDVLYRYRKHSESLSARKTIQATMARDRVVLNFIRMFPDTTSNERSEIAMTIARRCYHRREYLRTLYCLGLGLLFAPTLAGMDLALTIRRKLHL